MKLLIDPTSHYSQDELRTLQVLEDEPLFNSLVLRIRRKISIPESGIKININKSGTIKFFDKLKAKKISYDVLGRVIQLILKVYSLPSSWAYTLTTIILYNTAILPEKKDDGYNPIELNYIGGLTKIEKRVKQNLISQRHAEIIINEGMTFNIFIDTLLQRREEIEILLGHLRKLPEIKLKKLDIYKRIQELSKRISDSKVADQLKRTPEIKLSFMPERKSINTYKNRYKKELIKLPKNTIYLSGLEELLR